MDVPLGQLPEPLPDFPLTLQCVWMVDEFTHSNGASCVVPGARAAPLSPPVFSPLLTSLSLPILQGAT